MGMDKMDLSKIQLWPIEKLIPYENNPRQNDSAVAAVAESIKEFGFKQPIVVDKDGIIITGHTRLKAAQQLELKTIPVLLADDLTPDQVKAYRLADNKTGELAFWDMEKLNAELDGIEMDMDPFGFGGITPPDISGMFDEPAEEKKEDNDEKYSYMVIVECESQDDQRSVYRELDTQGLKCSMKTI